MGEKHGHDRVISLIRNSMEITPAALRPHASSDDLSMAFDSVRIEGNVPFGSAQPAGSKQ